MLYIFSNETHIIMTIFLNSIRCVGAGIFIFSATTLNAQSINYKYDSAGNRILKYTNATRSLGGNDTEQSANRLSDYIKVFMKPNNEQIEILFSRFDYDAKYSITITTSGGQLLYSTNKISMRHFIDVSDMPSGVYLVNINLNDKNHTWKVTKK